MTKPKTPEGDYGRKVSGPLFEQDGTTAAEPDPVPIDQGGTKGDTLDTAKGPEFKIPPGAQRHINDAEDPHNIARIDTLEGQVGGRFAAELSTLGSRAVTGHLPGGQPSPKVEKPQRPKRWEQPVRRYISPKDTGPPPHIAREMRGE